MAGAGDTGTQSGEAGSSGSPRFSAQNFQGLPSPAKVKFRILRAGGGWWLGGTTLQSLPVTPSLCVPHAASPLRELQLQGHS